MAERFPQRSTFSAISSSKSGSVPPQSDKSSQSNSSRRRRSPELPRPNQEIQGSGPAPATSSPKPASRTRIRDNSPAVPPAPIDPADFLSNPKSEIGRKNPKVRQIPRSIERGARNTKLSNVDLFDPRANQETVSDIVSDTGSPNPSPNTQLREPLASRRELPTAPREPLASRRKLPTTQREPLASRRELPTTQREPLTSRRELPTTPTPRSRSRLGSPSIRAKDTETPLEVKTQPAPKSRPQGETKPSKKSSQKPAPQTSPPLVYATRLLILGVGIAVICGTVLSAASAWNRSNLVAQEQSMAAASGENKTESAPATPIATEALQLNQEISALKTPFQILATENPNLTAGIFLVDLDTGGYLNFNGDVTFAAASTIKVPILIAFFQAVDEGKVQLDRMLTLQQEHIAGGSGELQDKAPGTKYSALEVAKKMIVVSDNTATNMIIELLGGKEVLNQQFAAWGLKATVINNNLPDLEGTNTTSPKDLINLMAQVDRGNLVSVKSRDRILQIMRQTENDSLLPKGLGEGAIIAHKTGNINSLLADSGMVDLPNGKRYLLTVMVKHPPETEKPAQTLIRDISRMSYRHLNGEATTTDAPVKIKN
ncbi:MAG: serine hydrolase [Microcoleus sp.]